MHKHMQQNINEPPKVIDYLKYGCYHRPDTFEQAFYWEQICTKSETHTLMVKGKELK